MEKKKRSDLIGVVIVLFLVLIIIISVLDLVNNFLILEKKEVYTNVIVSDHIGFDLNTSALTFGKVQPGGSANRNIFLMNEFERNVRVIIKAKGNISDYLIVSENDFVLERGEEKQIDFSVEVPGWVDAGLYDGYIKFIFKKVYKND